MSAFGTSRSFADARTMSAIECNSDIQRIARRAEIDPKRPFSSAFQCLPTTTAIVGLIVGVAVALLVVKTWANVNEAAN